MLCARNAIEAAPPALLGELGKMAMVSGAAAKLQAASFIPSWASSLPSVPSPMAVARAVANEWPRVSMCAAVGLGLYLAYPYVPVLRHRPMPTEAREVRRDEPRMNVAAEPTTGVSTAALHVTGVSPVPASGPAEEN
jgi:hypothetical protein